MTRSPTEKGEAGIHTHTDDGVLIPASPSRFADDRASYDCFGVALPPTILSQVPVGTYTQASG